MYFVYFNMFVSKILLVAYASRALDGAGRGAGAIG